MADEPRDDFLAALYWTLQSLRLAGIKRVPANLLPQLAATATANAAGVPSPSTGGQAPPSTAPGSGKGWGDMAAQLRQQLDRTAARSAAAPAARPAALAAQPARSPAPAMAPPRAATTPRPAQAAENATDESLRPARPLDPQVVAELAEWAKKVSLCTRCPELVANRTQTVFADGPPNADLMFIGEGPGEDEDRQGFPFVGRAGQLLNKIIAGGMKMRREDVYICNIVKCRPPQNRAPSPVEAAHCREYLDAQIQLVRPRVICCLGAIAAHFLLDLDTPVGRMRGQWYDYRGMAVRVTYHPAYLLRNYTAEARQKVWDDVLQVVEKLRQSKSAPAAPKRSSTDLL